RAVRPRIEEGLAAGPAFLDEEPALSCGVPVLLRLEVEHGEVPRRGPRHLRHQSTPTTSVPVEENHPPVPFTAASFASATCLPSASPRSCRAASMIRKIPRIPGWFDERPPPSVFVGSDPSSVSRPPSTNGPPSPFPHTPS